MSRQGLASRWSRHGFGFATRPGAGQGKGYWDLDLVS